MLTVAVIVAVLMLAGSPPTVRGAASSRPVGAGIGGIDWMQSAVAVPMGAARDTARAVQAFDPFQAEAAARRAGNTAVIFSMGPFGATQSGQAVLGQMNSYSDAEVAAQEQAVDFFAEGASDAGEAFSDLDHQAGEFISGGW